MWRGWHKLHVGWFSVGEEDWKPFEAFIGWRPDPSKPIMTPGIYHFEAEGYWGVDGDNGVWGSGAFKPHPYGEHSMELWARASNAVQYIAGGRS